MSEIRLDFSIEGVPQVAAMFDTAGRKAGNLRNAFSKISDFYRGEIVENYNTKGGIWGRWARRKKAYPWPLLSRTGTMAGNFAYDVGSRSLVISNPTDYFKYHQSSKPRKSNLPRRVMFDIQDPQRAEAMRILQRHIMER